MPWHNEHRGWLILGVAVDVAVLSLQANGQPVQYSGWKARLKASCLGTHALAVKVRKGAQGVTVMDAFAQLAIIPVLDTHEDERAQGLCRHSSVAAGVGVLQPVHQILAHLLDQRGVVVEESENAL